MKWYLIHVFRHLASERQKTHQLIGVSLNPLWQGRLRPLRREINDGLHADNVKVPNHTTWDLSRSGSIVPLVVRESSTSKFFSEGMEPGCRDIPQDYNVGRVA